MAAEHNKNKKKAWKRRMLVRETDDLELKPCAYHLQSGGRGAVIGCKDCTVVKVERFYRLGGNGE